MKICSICQQSLDNYSNNDTLEIKGIKKEICAECKQKLLNLINSDNKEEIQNAINYLYRYSKVAEDPEVTNHLDVLIETNRNRMNNINPNELSHNAEHQNDLKIANENDFIKIVSRSYEIADEIAQLGHKMDLIDQRDSNYKAHNPLAVVLALLIMVPGGIGALFFDMGQAGLGVFCMVICVASGIGLQQLVNYIHPDIRIGRERIPVLLKEWSELRNSIEKAWRFLENAGIAHKYKDDIDNLDSVYRLFKTRYTDPGRSGSMAKEYAKTVVNGIIKYSIPTAIILCGIVGGLSGMVNSAGSQIGSSSSAWHIQEIDEAGNIFREYDE